MVEVDAVSVAYLQVVEQLDALYHRPIATNEMHRPVSAFTDGHVANGEILHIGQRQDMRTRVEGLRIQRLQLV